MIEVTGVAGSPEHRTALKIAKILQEYWPGIKDSNPEDELIKIAANVKLANYAVSDIDIVIAAKLKPSRYIISKRVLFDKDGKRVNNAKILVRSFIAAIEVKDQSESGLEISAGNVNVRYQDGWKSATDQNDKQKYALRKYCQHVSLADPWIYRCLNLEGIQDLPSNRGRQMPEAATVSSVFNAPTLLSAMISENTLKKTSNGYIMSSGSSGIIERVLDAGLFNPLVPSALDRKSMDRIASRPDEARKLAEILGEKRLHLRGEGGTGKTVLLAQIAHEAYKFHEKRCLFLTYNVALAADLQRLLSLMNIPSSSEEGGVDVRTVMSFTYSWLHKLGVTKTDEISEFENYEKQCEELKKYFDEGVLGQTDIKNVKEENSEQFHYDAILVDEAQDWPQGEADVLMRLYGEEKVSLADGMSQLIRGSRTNWKPTISDNLPEVKKAFHECLRMKKNLGIFANAVAERADLNWSIQPNSQAAGGRVIISTSPFHQLPDLHNELLEKSAKVGNSPIDSLYCVAPSSIRTVGNRTCSELSTALKKAGHNVWDGTDPELRRDFPRSQNDHRIIQYDSCRGLEGWTVVLDAFDEFWSLRYDLALSQGHRPDNLIDDKEWASQKAWQWAMIPITRPIDTLVITLNDETSTAGKLLLAVSNYLEDFVEIK